MAMRLHDKTVLITGASTGIGRELAVQLAERECRLLLVARRGHLLSELVESLPGGAEKHRFYVCDVSDSQRIEQVCGDILANPPLPQVLILNAGVGGGFTAEDIDIDRFRYLFEVNFFNAVHFLRNLLPPMIRRGTGLVAATGSLAAYRGMPRSAPYSASKAALSRLIESLRIDLCRSGLKFTLISPGFVQTPMTDKNDFYMPFMISVQKAVRIIIRGLEREKTEIHFPLRMSLAAKLARFIPDNLYAGLMHGKK